MENALVVGDSASNVCNFSNTANHEFTAANMRDGCKLKAPHESTDAGIFASYLPMYSDPAVAAASESLSCTCESEVSHCR